MGIGGNTLGFVSYIDIGYIDYMGNVMYTEYICDLDTGYRIN